MVQSTIFNGVVKLGDLNRIYQQSKYHIDGIAYTRRIEFLLLYIAEVFKELLPTFSEQPGFVATTPGDDCEHD